MLTIYAEKACVLVKKIMEEIKETSYNIWHHFYPSFLFIKEKMTLNI